MRLITVEEATRVINDYQRANAQTTSNSGGDNSTSCATSTGQSRDTSSSHSHGGCSASKVVRGASHVTSGSNSNVAQKKSSRCSKQHNVTTTTVSPNPSQQYDSTVSSPELRNGTVMHVTRKLSQFSVKLTLDDVTRKVMTCRTVDDVDKAVSECRPDRLVVRYIFLLLLFQSFLFFKLYCCNFKIIVVSLQKNLVLFCSPYTLLVLGYNSYELKLFIIFAD